MDVDVHLITRSFFWEVRVSAFFFPVEFRKSSAYSLIARQAF